MALLCRAGERMGEASTHKRVHQWQSLSIHQGALLTVWHLSGGEFFDPMHVRDDMATKRTAPATVDEYISAFSPDVQTILQKVRQIVRSAAPDARETISYRIPAFKMNGVLVYFAAFKNHIGFYPPIRGDARLEKAVARYAGEKGNLRFPLDQPIPFDLIERIAKLRLRQDLSKAASTGKKVRT